MDKYKILVAEDSETILTSIQNIIVKYNLNYELYFASDGHSACKKALEIKPDLILIDMVMPIMDGIRAIKILKRIKVTRSIPIIAMTSSVNFLYEAFNAGANDYIYKSFDEIELLFRLSFALTLDENIKKTR